jgi:hypothetical protein
MKEEKYECRELALMEKDLGFEANFWINTKTDEIYINGVKRKLYQYPPMKPVKGWVQMHIVKKRLK